MVSVLQSSRGTGGHSWPAGRRFVLVVLPLRRLTESYLVDAPAEVCRVVLRETGPQAGQLSEVLMWQRGTLSFYNCKRRWSVNRFFFPLSSFSPPNLTASHQPG